MRGISLASLAFETALPLSRWRCGEASSTSTDAPWYRPSRRAIVTDILDFAELSARTFCTSPRELSSRQGTSESADAPQSPRELNGVSERPMIIGMPTTSRSQQRYDHRLRDLLQRPGDLSLATDLGVPRSTARGWLGAAPRAVVSLDVAHLTELELRREILKLRRRVKKLAALLRLALALLHASGFRLSGERLPDVPAK